jgi:hypothetical protein
MVAEPLVEPVTPHSMHQPSGLRPMRIGALVVLVIAFDLWLTHNFGFGIENPFALAPAVAVASGIAMRFLRPAERKGFKKWIDDKGRLLYSEPVLVGLYLTTGSLMATVSTVTIIRDSSDRSGLVRVAYVDDPSRPPDSASLSDSLVRFTVRTTPFGRSVLVTVPGFVPTTFSVSPLIGLTLRLGHDLPVSPAVLFRPGVLGLRSLADGGTFRVWAVSPRDTTLVGKITGIQTAVLLGDPQPVPAAVEDWKLELTGMPETLRDQMLLAWKRAAFLPHQASLGPGTTLLAEIWSRTHARVASTTVELSSEPLLDVPLPDLPIKPGENR